MKILVIGRGLIGQYIKSYMPQAELVSSSKSLKLLKKKSYDYVINCTFDDNYNSSFYNASSSFDSNIIKLISSSSKYVMLSSRKVYQTNQQWNASELLDINPKLIAGFYGKNKLASESFVKENLHKDQYLILRLPNIFGLRGNIPNNLNFFDQMYDNLKKNRVIKFNFNRYTKKDFMYAEDFAKVLKVCIEDHIYGTFNCGYGNPVACNKLAEILINSLGYGNIEDLNEIKDEFFLNTSKIKSKIDLPAFKGLEKGIKEIISNNF